VAGRSGRAAKGRRGGTTVLRAARLGDAAAMARVMRAAVRAEAGRYPADLLRAWGALPALYHRWAVTVGGEARVVAACRGRVVGFAGWRGREVTAVFVLPREAGRGLGRRLLARAEAGADRPPAPGAADARRGPARLEVVAARGAVPFYRACGWRGGPAVRAPLPGGGALPARRMWKQGRLAARRGGRGGAP